MIRILLIEDDPLYGKLVRMLLEDSGCTVTLAGTAEEGVRLAGAEVPDLILMDMHLPGADGFETIRRLRGDPRVERVPTIGFTAAAVSGEEERLKAREAGFDAYMTKPVNMAEVRAMLEPFRGSTPSSGAG